MARRILNVILCVLMSISLSACTTQSSQDILNGGMSQFVSGKTEEDYDIINTGVLLDDLIDKYSGSYYQPSKTPMTDDEHEDAKKAQGDTSSDSSAGTGKSESSNDDNIPVVSDMTGLMRVFHDAYDNTSEYIEFKTDNGFTFDFDTDLQTIYTTLQREDPIDVSGVESWSTWNNGNEYYVSINYSFTVDKLKSIKSETVKLVDEAVKKIGADGLSDYEIVCAVNNYLCDIVYYPDKEPYEPITHTAYGALKNGCAVCEGYACATKLILNSYGVESDIEVGYCLNGGGHAWNLVKLDNAWYQLDVTWNDQSNSRTDYLLVTDEYMKQSRTWEKSDYPVSAKNPYSG